MFETEKMKNPYLRKGPTNQQQSSTSSSGTGTRQQRDRHPTRNPIHKPNDEFIKSLKQYTAVSLGTSGGGGGGADVSMNVSFSISSHAMRQRKLLRKIIFEMKQLMNTNSNDDGDGDGHDDEMSEECSWEQIQCGSCLMRCSSMHDLHVNDMHVRELILQVMDSVNVIIMEEYVEHRLLLRDMNANAYVNHDHGTGKNGNGGDMNMNATLNMSCLGNNHIQNHNNHAGMEAHDLEASENLMTALEFLNVAYSCLDPSLVLTSLQSVVDVDASIGMDMGIHVGVGMGEDGIDGDEDQTDTILDALLHFILHNNPTPTPANANPKSNGIKEKGSKGKMKRGDLKLSWNKLQTMSLAIMTKGILCAEYIQAYCTSLSILPMSEVQSGSGGAWDSLLGNGMGLGLSIGAGRESGDGDGGGCARVAQLAHVAQKVLDILSISTDDDDFTNTMQESQDSVESDHDRMNMNMYNSESTTDTIHTAALMEWYGFKLSCMGLVSVLCRTGWLSQLKHQEQQHCGTDNGISIGMAGMNGGGALFELGPLSENEQLIENLYHDVQGISQRLSRLSGGKRSQYSHRKSGGGISGYASFATAAMALSLLTLIQTSAGSVGGMDNDGEKLVIENDTLQQLFEKAFEGDPKGYCSIGTEGAFDAIIHLCNCQNNGLRRFVKSDVFGNLLSGVISKSFLLGELTSDGNGSCTIPAAKRCRRGGLLFAFLHLNAAAGPAFRKAFQDCIAPGGDKEDETTLSKPSLLSLSTPSNSSTSKFVQVLLNMATDISMTAPALLFLKSLLVQSTLNGQWEMRDKLASTTWNSIIRNPIHANNSKCGGLQDLTVGILSRFDKRASLYSAQGMLNLLEFLCSDSQFQTESMNFVLGQDTIAILVKMLKSTGVKVVCTGTCRPLKVGMQLGAATLLSRKCLHCKGDNTTVIKRVLKRFATNSLFQNDNTVMNSRSDEDGAIEYALNQSASRDMTRRVLNLQSILSLATNEDSLHLANIIFESKLEKETRVSSLGERMKRQQEQLEIINEQRLALTKQRNQISDYLAKCQSQFQRELRHKLSVVRADGFDMAQALTDEKNELSKRIIKVEDCLSTEREKVDEARRDAEIQSSRSEQVQAHLKKRIGNLEEELVTTKMRLETSEQENVSKEARLTDSASVIEGKKVELSRMVDHHKALANENNCTKERLEEALVQLISMAQIYSSTEQKHNEEYKLLLNKNHDVKSAIDDEVVRRRRAEEKYSQLKEKYIEAKDKYKADLDNRDEQRRREDLRQRQREEESRQEEMKKRDDEKRREDRRKRHEEDKIARRRQDGRRPMGTLEFMNSLHDTSMRSERHTSSHNRKNGERKTSSRSGSKKSAFRIIK